MANIRIPSNLEQRDVEDIIESAISAMESSNDPIERDVTDLCAESRYNNRTADDFFQIVVNVFSYGAEQAFDKNIDPFESRNFSKLVDGGLNMAFACIALDDRQISRECSRDEIDDMQALRDDYEVIKRDVGGSRGGGRRGGRDRGRDRNDRNDRHERNSRGGRSGGRSARRSGRRGDGANNQPTAYRTREREEEHVEERETRRRDTPRNNVVDISELRNRQVVAVNSQTGTGHVYNPSNTIVAAIEEDGKFIEVLKAVEDYSKHELRRSLLTHEQDRRVVPLVKFKDTSENVVAENDDPVEVYVAPNVIKIDLPLINFDPLMIAVAAHPVMSEHSAKINLVQAIFQAKFTLPYDLAGIVTTLTDFNTFEGWYKVLNAMRSFAVNKDTPEEDTVHIMTEVTRLDQMLAALFNGYMTTLGYPKVKLTKFIESWSDASEWLSHRDQADLNDEFTEFETKLFASNMKVALPSLRAVEDGEDSVPVTVPTFFIERSAILVQYVGSIVGDEVEFSRTGEPCTITFDDTPDFYTSCNRLAKRRKDRFSMADIYMTDSVGRLIVVGVRENNSGPIRATMYR